jgi:D-glycero-D-manno-heptose 1,7-bisphosphate phosphatase
MLHKAIFLDRDGIINKERGAYTWQMNDFEFVDDLVKSLRKFIKHDYKLIIISNQSGIGKGVYQFADVELLHAHILRYMRINGIEIAEIYYCPHHPDTSRCICRKPDSQLLEKAIARFQIDPAASYFIGDREQDVEAARRVHVKGILVASNSSLLEVADKIVHSHAN